MIKQRIFVGRYLNSFIYIFNHHYNRLVYIKHVSDTDLNPKLKLNVNAATLSNMTTSLAVFKQPLKTFLFCHCYDIVYPFICTLFYL